MVKPGAYLHNSCLLGLVLIVTVYLHCVKLAQASLKKIIGFEKTAEKSRRTLPFSLKDASAPRDLFLVSKKLSSEVD